MTSQLYVSELWEAYVNDQGIGLTLFVPGQPPYIQAFQRPPSAPKNSGTHYCSPRTYFSFGPHSVLEGDVYLFAGDYRQARQTIYSLHKSLPHKDVFAPFGAINEPRRDAKCTGQLNVSGWAMDDTQVSEVNVLLDEHFVGRANYGTPRPDVKNTWPHAPDDVGFKYTLDTTRYPNGKHLLGADVKDPSGNIGSFARVPILIDNPPGADKSN